MPGRIQKCKVVSFRLSAAEYDCAMEICERLGHESVPLLARSVLLKFKGAESGSSGDTELARLGSQLEVLTEYLKQYLAVVKNAGNSEANTPAPDLFPS